MWEVPYILEIYKRRQLVHVITIYGIYHKLRVRQLAEKRFHPLVMVMYKIQEQLIIILFKQTAYIHPSHNIPIFPFAK